MRKRTQKFKQILMTTIGIMLMVQSYGQMEEYDDIIEPYLQRPIESGFLFFHPEGDLVPGQCFTIYKDVTGDTENDVVLLDDWIDPQIEMHHYKYRQTYKGIPVEGAVLIEHFDRTGVLKFTNGKLAVDLNLNVSPQFSEQAAKNHLLSTFPQDWVMAWENAHYEQDIKQNLGDSTATNEPTGELVLALDNYANLTWNIDGSRYRLAYKFTMHTISPIDISNTYFVDANTGEVFKTLNDMHYDGPATVQNDEATEVRTLDNRYRGFPNFDYVLETNNGETKIHTKYAGGAWIVRAEIDHSDESWIGDEINATTAHWYAEQAWYYFRDVWERNGTDGDNENLRLHIDIPVDDFGGINAGYQRNTGLDNLYFYAFDGLSPGNYSDIVGHEFVHGVINYSSELIYQAESGALNESFADIFGMIIKRHALYGGTGGVDWTYGDAEIGITRSLENPKVDGSHVELEGDLCTYITGQPDTYLGEFWQDVETISCDNFGVHGNSGVQNHWFYLLTDGGSGINDNDDSYDINGIGVDDAVLIAYWNMVNVLTESAQISDAREGAIATAITFFGECSNQQHQTTNAWYAVGVGEESSCEEVLSNSSEIQINDEISFYPNPTDDKFIVNWTKDDSFRLALYSTNGQQIFIHNDLKSGHQIDVSGLSQGVYIVEIKTATETIRKRIVKK